MKRIASNRRLFLLAGGGLALSGLAGAQTTLYTKVGSGTNDRLGASVGSAGDYNGDGNPDFIAGAPEDFSAFSPAPGYARVYSGINNGATLETIPGVANWDAFGSAVHVAGDWDGDMKDDVIIGAPSAGNSQRGQATVFSMSTGVLHTFSGDADLDFLGHSVGGGLDVNADGFPDVVVGVPGHDGLVESNIGQARVYSGEDGGLLWSWVGEDAGDQFGISVCQLGDTNGDGGAEVVVGSLAGGVKVFSGVGGNELIQIFGPANSTFGRTVCSIPDVTGDGKPDFLIGATEENVLTPGTGFVQCRNGVTYQLVWTAMGLGVGDRFGIEISGTEDWNADGVPDAVVAANPTNGAVQNYVRILSGVDGSLVEAFLGDTPQDDFGSGVAGLGDLNGDNRNDVAIGASTASPNGTASGYVRVYSGLVVATCGDITPYCTGVANSTGTGSTLFTSGTTSVAANDLVLLANNVPPAGGVNQPGIFYYGQNQTSQPFGNGFRCIANPAFRLPPAQFGGAGLAFWPLDLTDAPANAGPGMITAGSTWNFQFWYRDPAAGGSGFNLSRAAQINFCP